MNAHFRSMLRTAADDLAATENRHRYPVVATLGSRLLTTIQPNVQVLERAIIEHAHPEAEFLYYPFDALVNFLNRLPEPHERTVTALVAFYDLGWMTREIDFIAEQYGDKF